MRPLSSDTKAAENGLNGIAKAMTDVGGFSRGADQNTTRISRGIARKIHAVIGMNGSGRRSLFALSLFSAVMLGAGLYSIGHLGSEANFFNKLGFAPKSLVISGHETVGNQGIEYALAPQLQNSIFAFDANAARDELLKNPWLKSANVRKVYPDTVVVNVVEREPFAFWKTSHVVTVIARDGVVLGEASPEHMKLPQVVGAGANLAASEFVSYVARFPKVVDRANAFVRVAKRRWNIVLKDGIEILLPEFGWKEALVELEALQTNRGILDRELVLIDLRLPDRMVLRLEAGSAQERKERLEGLLERSWHRT